MFKHFLSILILIICQGLVFGDDLIKTRSDNIEMKNVITVGPSNADVIGTDNFAIQLAIDALALRGGGTVRVLPGEYMLINSIKLRSNIHLTGVREKTILKHCPAISSPLLKDADIGQKEITPKDPTLFKSGMGIVCRSDDLPNAMSELPLTITRIENGVLYLNDYINDDFIAELDSWGKGGHNGLVANVFPLIHGYYIENATVDGFTVDSYVNENPGWIGIRTGGVCMVRCKNITINNVKSFNCQGDGILIVSCEHVTVENCETAYNTFHGIHPGSHSPWTKVQNCHIHHNGSDGLYICWGVRESEFVDNNIHYNGIRKQGGKRGGISIVHKDTDNLIARNQIYENALYGISFRKKTEANGAHRNTIKDNIIENNGLPKDGEMGNGIYINGITRDLVFENNTIRETREGENRYQLHAFYIEPEVTRIKMVNNKISGHPKEEIIDKSNSPDNTLQKVSNIDTNSEQEKFVKNFLNENKNNPKLLKLKSEYNLEQVVSKGKDKFSKMVLLNDWVYNQFKKFGKPTYKTENALEILEKIKEGHTFYCAHYTIVFVSTATALGWQARPVSLRFEDYPRRVSNHNVAEIWSSQFNKWIMFDPTMKHYITKDNIPLNCYEIAKERIKNKGKDIRFVVGTEKKEYTNQDLPVLMKYYEGYGNLQIDDRSLNLYACLAYVPTNRLLGDFPNKSIEIWDNWDNITVIFGNKINLNDEVSMLAPYYKP